jgi:hypothetical protein
VAGPQRAELTATVGRLSVVVGRVLSQDRPQVAGHRRSASGRLSQSGRRSRRVRRRRSATGTVRRAAGRRGGGRAEWQPRVRGPGLRAVYQVRKESGLVAQRDGEIRHFPAAASPSAFAHVSHGPKVQLLPHSLVTGHEWVHASLAELVGAAQHFADDHPQLVRCPRQAVGDHAVCGKAGSDVSRWGPRGRADDGGVGGSRRTG